jgi:hypothetical protein
MKSKLALVLLILGGLALSGCMIEEVRDHGHYRHHHREYRDWR